jgi:hypothetical protein
MRGLGNKRIVTYVKEFTTLMLLYELDTVLINNDY